MPTVHNVSGEPIATAEGHPLPPDWRGVLYDSEHLRALLDDGRVVITDGTDLDPPDRPIPLA